jgi:hypothetical protein
MQFVCRRVCLLAALLFAVIGSLSIFGSAQENAIRVGVAVMQNQAGRSVPGNIERDRLVAALNHMKPDKKTHVKVVGVPLNGSTREEISDEAGQQKCQYVVYTTLMELRNADDPYQHVPGTIEANPNPQWSHQNGQAERMDPEYRVTVDYQLVSVGSSNVVASAPFSTQAAMNEIDAVSQVMDRIASRVADEVKKAAPPAMKE